MTILFTIYQSGSKANGGVESITRLIESIPDVDKVILTQAYTEMNERWEMSGVETLVIKGGRFAVMRKVFSLLGERSFDVVHCNDIQSLLWCLPALKLRGCRIVFNVRDIFETNRPYTLKWSIAGAFTHRVVCLSKEMRDALQNRLKPFLGRRAPIDFVYSICDIIKDDQLKARRDLGLKEDGIYIGYVANVCEKKNQLRFLELAASQILQTSRAVRIVFIGDFEPAVNAYAAKCKSAKEALEHSDRIEFRGFSSEVRTWNQAFDCVVLASRREGLARCMIEALAAGTPVVSFDVCSAREILEEGHCGRVVNQGDYRSLADSAVDLIRNVSERQAMGIRGRQLAERLFESGTSAEGYRQIWDEVCGKR